MNEGDAVAWTDVQGRVRRGVWVRQVNADTALVRVDGRDVRVAASACRPDAVRVLQEAGGLLVGLLLMAATVALVGWAWALWNR